MSTSSDASMEVSIKSGSDVGTIKTFKTSQDMADISGRTGSTDCSHTGRISIDELTTSEVHSKAPGPYASPALAKREQRAIFRTKICLAIVLLAAVVGISLVAAKLIMDGEKKDFEDQFQNSFSEIVTVARESATTKLNSFVGFSTAITSHARETGKVWPLVNLPDWSVRAQQLAELTKSYAILFTPIVEASQRTEWETHVTQNVVKWYQESIINEKLNVTVDELVTIPMIFALNITTFKPTILANDTGPWLPVGQVFPLAPEFTTVNFNFLNGPRLIGAYNILRATEKPALNFVQTPDGGRSQILTPIFDQVDNGKNELKMVGAIWAIYQWSSYFENILTDMEAEQMHLVVKNSCHEEDDVTYFIQGPNVTFVDYGDHHDRNFDYMELSSPFFALDYDESKVPDGACTPTVSLHLYPTSDMRSAFQTNTTYVYTALIVAIFVITAGVFLLYDFFVRRQKRKYMQRVIRQDKIMSNVFPAQFRDKLYGLRNENSEGQSFSGTGNDDLDSPDIFGKTPLAEFYPAASVIFADIAGFTAWSSAREPAQVFTLLENIYGAFDKLAYRHGVFKVETVGDCYVAVTGLPEANEDHAVDAARFARSIIDKMKELTHGLEVKLGPDTTDLELRIGIHSGQVTAGVLRGERARFQLFGDTVNTAARMEDSSARSRIQISESTAKLLKEKGKAGWVKKRLDKVNVKGKGEMQTYWVLSRSESRQKERRRMNRRQKVGMGQIVEEKFMDEEDDVNFHLDSTRMLNKTQRLVEWNVQVLSRLLQQIVAARSIQSQEGAKKKDLSELEARIGTDGTILEEFQPIIELKRFSLKDLANRANPDAIQLSEEVRSQLRDFLTQISKMYRDNHFHNFEHASHVTASVRKLLTRIVSVGDAVEVGIDLSDLVGHSYGITSDPMTQFAVVFSALIHDLDHPGVPNAQLVKEKTRAAQLYKNLSIAEQNSVDLAWGVLMSPKYATLRSCIYTNQDELKRFRQLVVNTVMATDIADKKLQALRKDRWETAFTTEPKESNVTTGNRKATIVIEHLIQASDVSHTMQHWHIFKRWNEHLFMEMYSAYRAGRSETDPSEGWYKGEIGFFDFYIIPLAKKLDSCGVFGVSSDEYLGYAEANRAQWAREGESIVKEYLEKYEKMKNSDADSSTSSSSSSSGMERC